MDKEKFEKDMEVFSFRQHQNVLTYLNHLEIKGWTTEEAKTWIKEEIEKRGREENQIVIPLKLCPECQRSMQLLAVNFSPATRIGDSSKSVWFCPVCGESIYNKEDIQTILRKEGR